MDKKRMRNPLGKRVPKELIGEWRKYLVIFLLLAITIGFVSGMYVANNSMLTALEDSVTRYKMEYGHFELNREADEQLLADLENTSVPVKLYENFNKDVQEDHDCDGEKDGKVRLYRTTDQINLSCYLEGEAPKTDAQIAIDRMHADNNGIKVGDTIRVQGKEMEVTGLISMAQYTTLYEKNTDSMFDAITFDVAVVVPEAFEAFDVSVHYTYAWLYDDEKLGDHAIDPSASEDRQKEVEKKLSDDYMMEVAARSMMAGNELKDFVPRYANMGVNFARTDLSGDVVMVGILLYVFIIMIAFIFGVTVTSTITREASSIGTLRASGYTKGELVVHYMTVPVVVTLVSAIVGNILGYTAFKFIVVGMYYNSYSLPTYVTIWNSEAFIRTTLVPVAIMILVTWIVIRRSLRFSPLRFLRHDLRSRKRKKAVKLPHFPFFHRFRLRVILQNIPNYLVLFFGLAFVMILLAFSFGLPATLNSYTESVTDEMFVKNQYILKSTVDETGNVVETSADGAERFSVTELKTTDGPRVGETITVYGVVDDSRYLAIPRDLAEDEVYVSSAYRDKFKLKAGDSITLKKPFTDDRYTFRIAGFKDYTGGLIVILPEEHFNQALGYEPGSFSGYMSDAEIKDIAASNIAASVTEEDVLKISRQLNHSMGDYMSIFQVVCFILAMIVIYMLSKVIIEKNENAISMVKILGYENKEIASLYLISTTWFVLISAVITSFVGVKALSAIWVAYMNKMDGWLPVHFGASDYLAVIAITFGAYLAVMLLDYFRIRRIPMDEALKNVE